MNNPKNAIDVLKNEIKCVNRRAGGECNGGTDCRNCDLVLPDFMVLDALRMAIEAVERRIPQKPVEETVNFDYGTKIQRCPSCGKPCRHYGKPLNSDDEDGCRKCGQAIDWGERE